MKLVGSLIVVAGIQVSVLLAPTPNTARLQDRPWMDKALSPLRRAELLVQQMTLDEKISQIHMLDKPDHPREVPPIERLGIPALKITNGPAGAGPGDSRPTQPATAMPSALALAASWDPKLAETFGRVVADEVGARGEDLLEAPGVNIARVPQNGRNFEYFGEDPYLAAQMVVPEIRGIQSSGIIAEVKHFAANNQENDRKTINEIIDERTLREIYLPAFEAAVKESDVGAVMCAYPSVNGQFGCENTHLLKEILRGDWGFKGFVQSDYTATRDAVANATAGLDLAMKPDHYDAEMKAAIKSGKISESVVDTMLVRRFTQMFRFGLFDKARTPTTIPAEKDGAIARTIAEQCAVLLKNQRQQLPLDGKAIHSIALIGPYAGAAHTGGGGSSAVTPIYTVTPMDGVKKHVSADVKLTYDDGHNPDSAVALAKTADVVLLMVGNKDREGRDRPDLLLPDKQDQLVSAVAAANPHTVVILKTGGPVLMPWLDQVAAVLEVWYPGEEDGNVVADLLFGNVNPSGKLPLTFPKAETDTPAHTPQQYPGVNGAAIYSEGLQVGYRWYDSQKISPLFPFGYGLSYTSFALQSLKAASEIRVGDSLLVSVNLANTGSRAGAEVVQVYVAAPTEAGEPPRQLKAFTKVTVRPNQVQNITVKLDGRAFSIWDKSKNRWSIVPGRYGLFVGTSSRDLQLQGSVLVHR
jgi:beta-glucosidase